MRDAKLLAMAAFMGLIFSLLVTMLFGVWEEYRPILKTNGEDSADRFGRLLRSELQRTPRLALGIISSVKGSSPQKQGAKALFLPDDRMIGTLGGGCLEAEIRRRARAALATGKAETFETPPPAVGPLAWGNLDNSK